MNIGSLVGYLGLDDSGFETGLQGALGKLGEFASKGAVKAAAAGVVIAGAIGAAVLGAMNVDAANDKLTAQLGLTVAESERIGGVAGELYSQAYSDSLSGVNTAVAAVIGSIDGMRKASSKDLQDVTAMALNFAEAMDVDVAGAAKTAGILVRTGLAEDAREAFDLLTVAAQEAGPAMVEPVMEAANEYAVNFNAMGISGRAAMAMLVDASKNGEIALDKVGDAVKEFSIRATDLGDTGAQEALEALGLSGQEMANKLLAGGQTASDAFYEITDGLLAIKDPAKQAEAAVALFGTPIEDLGKDQIPGFLAAMQQAGGELENVEGAADRMGDTLNDNASTNIESFKRQAQTAFVDILGGKVLPIAEDVVKFLAENFGPALDAAAEIITTVVIPALQGMWEWLQDNEVAAGALGGAAGVVSALVAAAWVAQGVVAAIEAAKQVAAWFGTATASTTSATIQSRSTAQIVVGWIAAAAAATANGVKIAAVWVAQVVAAAVTGAASFAVQAGRVVAGWVLMGAQSLAQAARMAAAWVLAMGPVGWVIAAVVGLVALIVANWDTVKRWTGEAFDWVWEKVKWAVGKMVDLFLNFTLVGLIIKHWDTIKSAFSNGVSAAVEFVRGLPGKAVGAIGDMGSLLYNSGRDLIQGLLDGAGSLLSKIGSFFLDKVPGWIKGPFKRALGISSPSKVFAGFGENIGEGLIIGLGNMQPAVAAEMMRLADTQALQGLTVDAGVVARPVSRPMPAADAGAGLSAQDAAAGGIGALVHAEQINIIEGTADDVARKLAVAARTGGLG